MTTDTKRGKTPAQKLAVQPLQANYEIKVQGHLDALWEQWFEGMTLTNIENGESGLACTLISGLVADQAALHGLLTRIRDLNLTLISVRRIVSNKQPGEEMSIDLSQEEESGKHPSNTEGLEKENQ
jgi:wyosine [tRNA(Phe)-imidazoG37] synthetase (radical SAM superfamily)